MAHLVVDQLRFSRSELVRCLQGVSDENARRRLGPMNCLSWIVGHLADHEHRYFVIEAQGRNVLPDLNVRVGYGQPASTPPLDEMWDAWKIATAAADDYLDTLTPARLETHLQKDGKPRAENVGTMLTRVIFHYWYHIGEASAIRQMLGHTGLPQFVARDMSRACYRRED